MLTVIIGKSGSGKDTLRNILTEKWGYEPILSVTTRQPRDNEKDGVDYHFVSNEEFEKMLATGEIFEYRAYESSKGNVCFGSRKYDLDPNKNYVRVVDPAGAEKYLEIYGRSNCFVVNVFVPDGLRYTRALKREGIDPSTCDEEKMEHFQQEWFKRLEDDAKKFSPERTEHLVNFNLDNTLESKDIMEEEFIEAMSAYAERIRLDKRKGIESNPQYVIVQNSDKENYSNYYAAVDKDNAKFFKVANERVSSGSIEEMASLEFSRHITKEER